MGVFRRKPRAGGQPLIRDAEALRAKIDGMRLRINAFVANMEREFYVIEETMKEVEQALEVVCRDLDDSGSVLQADTSARADEVESSSESGGERQAE
jgi:hypothetical protein